VGTSRFLFYSMPQQWLQSAGPDYIESPQGAETSTPAQNQGKSVHNRTMPQICSSIVLCTQRHIHCPGGCANRVQEARAPCREKVCTREVRGFAFGHTCSIQEALDRHVWNSGSWCRQTGKRVGPAPERKERIPVFRPRPHDNSLLGPEYRQPDAFRMGREHGKPCTSQCEVEVCYLSYVG
jgi:hypothetical protein